MPGSDEHPAGITRDARTPALLIESEVTGGASYIDGEISGNPRDNAVGRRSGKRADVGHLCI